MKAALRRKLKRIDFTKLRDIKRPTLNESIIKKVNDKIGKEGIAKILNSKQGIGTIVKQLKNKISNKEVSDIRSMLGEHSINANSNAVKYKFFFPYRGAWFFDLIVNHKLRENHKNELVKYFGVFLNGNTGWVKAYEINSRQASEIKSISEPFVIATIMTPSEYIGPIMELCQGKRGRYISMDYIDTNRVTLEYELPLSEVIFDFFDKLKSQTRGYASFDYQLSEYKPSNLVKMDILLNGDRVDALSAICHKDFVYPRGKALVQKLRGLIPRQMFEIPVQAAVNGKIIARENIAALRKDVLAKCYGGDVSRKKKLLEKQKEGKKRMKQVGSVEIPQEAFLAVLKIDE